MHPAQADRRRAQVGVAALAVLLAAADSYVVVLALPDIMTGVGIDVDQLQRATPIVTGFLLGYIVGLPPLGRLSDLYGRVPVLLASLGVFCVGCVITAGSHDLGAVVVGRALQGVGGGGLVPATLALVADRWPEDRRGTPLGAVGAAQEFGSVLGPLYGGAVLAVSGWRTIFWANLGGGLVLAGALVGITRGARASRRPPGAVVTAVLAALALAGLVLVVTAPATLTGQLTIGAAYVPVVAGAAWSSPLVLLTAALATGVAGLLWRRGTLRRLSTEADLIGAGLLGLALAGLVLAFATADPSRQALADRAPALLGGAALCAGLFAWRQRRARHPLVPGDAVRPTAGWGALAVNLFVGAALIAALVDVPLFARATRYPDSQLGAALVLVELLAALPVGALLGGLLCRRLAPRSVATVGLGLTALGFLGMSRWGERALDGPAGATVLVLTGLGFGLAIAPVNVALLAATRSAVHGIASALAVVARMAGMLAGLSVLTAVGLRVFYARQAKIGSPLALCPADPAHCPAYTTATRAAVLSELHATFAGAAICAATAGVLAAVLLRQDGRHDRDSGAAPAR